ncbi:hypothetical protein NDU88_005159 [Pleurodeles waltl]|uniref:Uncharacterized protein n=1 Tax=Pleurodeles waltl TaxID=8319 RepID=A0AAV7WAQ0_PLEWA|nr:hypothetical protein NDU88_005159 [Pleurodeles waltl]
MRRPTEETSEIRSKCGSKRELNGRDKQSLSDKVEPNRGWGKQQLHIFNDAIYDGNVDCDVTCNGIYDAICDVCCNIT